MNKRTSLVRDLLERYLLSREYATCAQSTRYTYRSVLTRVADSKFGDIHLDKLVFSRVDAYFDEWIKASGNPSALKMQAVMRVVWEYGIRNAWVKENPWRSIRTKSEPSRDVVWTPECIEKVRFFALRHGDLKQRLSAIIFYCAYAAVQRIGDIRTLTMSNLVMPDKALSIVQNKTEKHVWIPLPNSAWELLMFAVKWARNSPWIFPGEDNKPMSHSAFFAKFHEVKKQLHIPPEFQARDARRTAIMELAEKGATAMQIQSLSGHSTAASIEPYLVANNPARNAMAENAMKLREMK